jgi:hypothetical protein
MSLTIRNYKKLEGWSHNHKDFRIGVIYETPLLYSFTIAYNGTPYIIKIFRMGTGPKQYEIVLRDGMDMIQYGRSWIGNDSLEMDQLVIAFENIIVRSKPTAKQTTGNINFNNPF